MVAHGFPIVDLTVEPTVTHAIVCGVFVKRTFNIPFKHIH